MQQVAHTRVAAVCEHASFHRIWHAQNPLARICFLEAVVYVKLNGTRLREFEKRFGGKIIERLSERGKSCSALQRTLCALIIVINAAWRSKNDRLNEKEAR